MLQLYGGGFTVALIQISLFYYSAGFLLHYVAPLLFRVHPIQTQERGQGEVFRDGPLAVKAAIWCLVEWMQRNNWGLLYTGWPTDAAQVLYMLVCVVILDYLHDAWFYWTHRLLHWKPLYLHVHYIHHRSKAPSAFTGYSFHILEALLVFANEVLVCFLFPMHMGLHRLYHLFTTLIHEGGHAGYEIAPFIPTVEQLLLLPFQGLKPAAALNTVQHHDMHHRFPNRHFSLYFTHWDRLMGTMHPKYDKELFSYW